jgi:hypothetical protein
MSLFKGGHRIYAESVGGYYIYLLPPDDVSDIELARDGANESIFIAPGSVFASTKTIRWLKNENQRFAR